MIELSVLDLVPVREGGTLAQAYDDAAALAQAAERLGFKRYWVAEHHAMEGGAGAATSVVLAHIGHATRTIRIGAGGIMLPNHNPFVIAEQFGTLDALFPGRVDLGLGRAPGADARFAAALRKDLSAAAQMFPRDVVELRALLTGEPELPIRANPGHGAKVELWMLGSSLFGASLAAQLGMPYAFASHFAPAMLDEALALYRQEFRPSRWLDQPHVMVAINLFAAPSEEEARAIASSQQQSFVRLRSGQPGKLPPPRPDFVERLGPQERAMLAALERYSAIGDPQTVARKIREVARATDADEIICAGATYEGEARIRSLELTVQGLSEESDGLRASRRDSHDRSDGEADRAEGKGPIASP